MTVDRKVSSIEASFKMENMQFDTECRQRVKNVLTKKVSVADAIAELNNKYGHWSTRCQVQIKIL